MSVTTGLFHIESDFYSMNRVVSRWKRDEFYAKIADMDESELQKILWTVYWRGAAPVRERIEELVEPERKDARKRTEKGATGRK